MILRRIKAHVQKEDWFAVFIDFIIVVFGVGMALLAEQWISNRQQAGELAEVEILIRDDLYTTYSSAKERLAISECRKARTRELATLLTIPGDTWIGTPWVGGENNWQPELARVMRSPFRTWGSRAWEAEQGRSTMDQMSAERRKALDVVFNMAKGVQDFQLRIFSYEARLKTLALTIEITPSDRLRYYDILSETDAFISLVELASGLIIGNIEAIGLEYGAVARGQLRKDLAEQNERLSTVYGACYNPIIVPFLEENKAEVETTQ